jgi:hypothetical protein
MPTMRLRFQRLENFTAPAHIPRRLFDWESGTFERDLRSRDATFGGGVLS